MIAILHADGYAGQAQGESVVDILILIATNKTACNKLRQQTNRTRKIQNKDTVSSFYKNTKIQKDTVSSFYSICQS
jgi:hypothetical protein